MWRKKVNKIYLLSSSTVRYKQTIKRNINHAWALVLDYYLGFFNHSGVRRCIVTISQITITTLVQDNSYISFSLIRSRSNNALAYLLCSFRGNAAYARYDAVCCNRRRLGRNGFGCNGAFWLDNTSRVGIDSALV